MPRQSPPFSEWSPSGAQIHGARLINVFLVVLLSEFAPLLCTTVFLLLVCSCTYVRITFAVCYFTLRRDDSHRFGKHWHKSANKTCVRLCPQTDKLTWLVLGEDPAARSHRVEQFTAL